MITIFFILLCSDVRNSSTYEKEKCLKLKGIGSHGHAIVV